MSERKHDEISHYLERALTSHGAKARKATDNLLSALEKQSDCGIILSAVSRLQQDIINSKNPQSLTKGSDLLKNVLNTTFFNPDRQDLFNINQRVAPLCQTLQKRHQRLTGRQDLQDYLPPNYLQLMTQVVPSLQKTSQEGLTKQISIRFSPAEERQQWHQKAVDLFRKRDSSSDEFTTVLKKERAGLLTRKFSNISLTDIEDMTSPLTEEDSSRITDYLIAAYSQKLDPVEQEVLSKLFSSAVCFYDTAAKHKINYVNQKLLVNLSQWQEQFLTSLLFPPDQATEAQIHRLLQLAPASFPAQLPLSLYLWTCYPHEMDPNYDKPADYAFMQEKHLLSRLALQNFQAPLAHQGILFVYADEIEQAYTLETLLPLLSKQADRYEVLGKMKEYIGVTEKLLKETAFAKIHFETLTEFFQNNSGESFLSQLDSRRAEIEAISQIAWQSIFEQGLNYLPMTQGINQIDFGLESVPGLLGFQSLRLSAGLTKTGWMVNLNFSLRETVICINGTLDQEGDVFFAAPFSKKAPGLFAILRHLAILTFHDLAVQTSKAPTAGLPRAKQAFTKIQTDRQLIEDVCQKTGFKPRPVEMHRRSLPGAAEYLNAISSYNEALQIYNQALQESTSENGQTLADALLKAEQRKLTDARTAFHHHPSPTKLSALPAKFKLNEVKDPETQEVRILQTWVIEHTSPKPTTEELRSLPKLFERYHKHSSALDSLELFKPWFVI